MMAQTSDKVSSKAGRMLNITPDQLLSWTATPALRAELAADIRSMAASLLAQDEVRGFRKMMRKVGL